jgi:hypothetical protein
VSVRRLSSSLLAFALFFVPPRTSNAQLVPAGEVVGEDTATTATESDSREGASLDSVHFELSARTAYTSHPVAGGINPFGFGAGGSVTLLLWHVMLGMSALAYAGGHDDAGTSESGILYGVEGGYEIRVGPNVSIRPTFGVGFADVTHTNTNATSPTPPPSSVAASNVPVPRGYSPVDVVTQASSSSGSGSFGGSPTNSSTTTSMYLAPGVGATVDTNAGWFAGLGGRVLYMPNVGYSYDTSAKWRAYSLELQFGFRL